MTTALLAIVFSPFAQGAPANLPFLNPIFSDHMVLQRDKPNTFWGWTTPGAKVTVTILNKKGEGIAGKDGKWMAKVSPPGVGGPYTVNIDGPTKVELHDVLVGDVWICSGQSNMEQGIAACNNPQQEIANANYPQIRLAMVPKVTSYTPNLTVPTGWYACTPENIAKGGWGGFSGVAYFFGRELNRRLKVPIGLIEDCWGGTIAEAWISRASVEKQGDFAAALARIDQALSNKATPFERQLEEWTAKADPGARPNANWQAEGFNDASWKALPGPRSYEAMGLGQFDGFVWYRAEVMLAGAVSGEATLNLGPIDDADVTWVNGTKVGSMSQWDAARAYKVPAGVLKSGRNVIAVRVLDTAGGGGFTADPAELALKLANGRTIPLSEGSWRYSAGPEMRTLPPVPQQISNNPNVPTVLYNAMIHPIVPLSIKGAIWYQGESNAGRGYQYRTVMPALINDWRKLFGQPDMPFFIVQLANFQARLPEPAESDWAELREAQAMTAQKMKNVGLATAIDIGEANDIHPRNKQDVGLRLALSALHIAYGQPGAWSGPVYRGMKVEGNSIRITFDHTEGGLMTKGGTLAGFSIAGKDKKFYWAVPKADGNAVLLSSPQVTNPVAVRYGWAINPQITLYNGAGLPAIPFRTDDWKGVTFGRK